MLSARNFFCVIGASFAAGCASMYGPPYAPPGADVPHASLLIRNESDVEARIWTFKDPVNCRDIENIEGVDPLPRGNSVEVRLRPDADFSLGTVQFIGYGGTICYSFGTFTPQAGGQYVATTFRDSSGSCGVVVEDRAVAEKSRTVVVEKTFRPRKVVAPFFDVVHCE